MPLRTLLALALTTLPLALLSCGDSSASPANPNEFKVALLVSGSTTDGGWNQLAWTAAQNMAAKDPNIKLSKLEKVEASKAAEEMRDFSRKGFNVVIGHGYEFMTPAREVAADMKSTRFIVSGSDLADPSVAALHFDLGQACYQLGIIAAKQSKTGKIAFIGGSEIPTVVSCAAGFEAGAKSVNPNIQMLRPAYPGWDRPDAAKAEAETFIKQGADVILQNVDAASKGVFEAVAEANSRQGNHPFVYTFGTNDNQNDNPAAGQWTLASAVIRMDEAFARQITAIRENKFQPGVVKEDLANGVCVTILNPKLIASGTLTPDTIQLVEAASKKIATGEIKVPSK